MNGWRDSGDCMIQPRTLGPYRSENPGALVTINTNHTHSYSTYGGHNHGEPMGFWPMIKKWIWVNTYRYIFSGMNIHLPAILMFTRYQGFDPSPNLWGPWNRHRNGPLTPTEAGIYNLPSSKGPPLEGGPMAEALLGQSFATGFILRSYNVLFFFAPKTIGGSVSKPCTPGEHQNSW